jgi:hypothetical protein
VIIQARPTIYRGIQMRSRLEARVAAWFDDHEIPWVYEPLCFADEEGQYLPDFELKDFGVYGRTKRPLYVEVKPTWALADQWKRRMQIIWSSIPEADLLAIAPGYLDFAFGADDTPVNDRHSVRPYQQKWLAAWGGWRDGPCAGLPAEAGLFHRCEANPDDDRIRHRTHWPSINCGQFTLSIMTSGISSRVCARCGALTSREKAITTGEIPIPPEKAGGR